MGGEKNIIDQEKMTLEEYQEKYSRPENLKAIRIGLFLLAATIGVIIITCIALVSINLYEKNEIFGYISIGVGVLIFIFLYLIPIIRISRFKAFKTNVTAYNAREAKRYNRALRNELSDKIIEYYQKVEGASWYSDENVLALIQARNKNDNELTKQALSNIFEKDIKKASDKTITSFAVQVGLITALSQSEKIDSLAVAVYNLNLIKEIIYLYGFRPSEGKLLKIYKRVIINVLTAYGASSATTGIVNTVTRVISNTNGVDPLTSVLSSVIGTLASSVIQGVVNGSLTASIGIETRRYLVREYHLQNVLDNVELVNQEEDEKLMQEVSREIKDLSKSKRKRKEREE